jgi:nicotinamidase-related amidase
VAYSGAVSAPGPTSALVLVDIQRGFDDPRCPSRNNPKAEHNAALLLSAWRQTARPVRHVQHASRDPGSTFHPSSVGFPIKAEVLPSADEPVLVKNVNSAFIGTDLEQRLGAAGTREVVFAGFTTPHCISTSVRMAGNLGFETWVVSDATASWAITGPDGAIHSAEEIHRVSLATLHEEFAAVIATATLLASFGEK